MTMKYMTVSDLIALLQKCDPDGVVCECANGGSTPYESRARYFKVRQQPVIDDKDWNNFTQSYENHRKVVYVELGQFLSHTECRNENSPYFVPFVSP